MSQPEGGWSYQIPDGPTISSEKVGGPGLKVIVQKLKEYRLANGIPEGDPETDICKAYSTRFPWLILKLPDEDTYSNDAEAWIHRVWRSYPIQMAETRARDERFEQCKKCVHFEPLDREGMSAEASRRLLLMNPAKFHVEHGWCLLRGWVPSVAVQLHQPIEFADEKSQSSDCWVDSSTKKKT